MPYTTILESDKPITFETIAALGKTLKVSTIYLSKPNYSDLGRVYRVNDVHVRTLRIDNEGKVVHVLPAN